MIPKEACSVLIAEPNCIHLKEATMKEREQERSGHEGKARSSREDAHAEMLQEALRRPGVREAMEVYRGWQRADNGLDSYREATKQPWVTATTDHANAR